MLEFIYKEDSYYYSRCGKQLYDITTKITMNNDADFSDVMEAILKLCKIATYNVEIEYLCKFVLDYAAENNQEDVVKNFLKVYNNI